MSAGKYNGWTNYDTWNVALWIDNEEGAYRLKREYYRQNKRHWTPALAEEFTREVYPVGTPDLENYNQGQSDVYAEVNWSEIADAWNSEEEE